MAVNPQLFTEIVEKVLIRLKSKRIAILWPEGKGASLAALPGISWVHYISGTHSLPPSPSYRLAASEDVCKEAIGLSMLLIPAASALLLAELCSGFPVSVEALFVSECLKRSVPTLLDCTAMNRAPFADETRRSAMLHAQSWFVSQGGALLGGQNQPAPSPVPVRDCSTEIRLEQAGWYSWGELRSKVTHGDRLLVGSGVRLTAEAQDRLRSLGVTVIEKG